MKTLIILIGPKGTGKTYIGCLVERELGIPFLRVESIWLSLKKGEDGWEKVKHTIDQRLDASDTLIIESLGAGDGFNAMRNSLSIKYQLRYVKISTESKECLRRVKTRDHQNHIPVSDDKVEVYNEIAAKVELPWSAVIPNNGPATRDEIIAAFSRMIKG